MESCHKKTDKEKLRRCLTTELTSSPRTMHHILWRKRKNLFSIYVRLMVQHSLNCMLEFYKQELISLEKKLKNVPQSCYPLSYDKQRIYPRRLFRRPLVDLNSQWTVAKENLLYKCGWSPLGTTLIPK
jgi:dihydroorotase